MRAGASSRIRKSLGVGHDDEGEDGGRYPQRRRWPTLDHWRGERVQYREDGAGVAERLGAASPEVSGRKVRAAAAQHRGCTSHVVVPHHTIIPPTPIHRSASLPAGPSHATGGRSHATAGPSRAMAAAGRAAAATGRSLRGGTTGGATTMTTAAVAGAATMRRRRRQRGSGRGAPRFCATRNVLMWAVTAGGAAAGGGRRVARRRRRRRRQRWSCGGASRS